MAMTTKYCSVTGAGAKNGTDAANAWDWAAMLAGAAAGDYVLVQEGTYSLTGSSSFSNAGTATSPIRLRGAKTDWTPLDPARTNAGLLSTANMPVINCGGSYAITTPNWSIFEGLKITGSRLGAVVIAGTDSAFRKCVIECSRTGETVAKALYLQARAEAFDCDVRLTGASGGTNAWAILCETQAKVVNCRVSAGAVSGNAIQLGDKDVAIIGNVIYSGQSEAIYGVLTDASATVAGNTIVGCASDGISIQSGTTRRWTIVGNLITDCGGYGINGGGTATAILSAMNRIDRCTSGAYNLATDWLASTKWGDDTTSQTQANEYEAAGSNDYRLKSTSPAVNKGPWLLADIGALQVVASGGYTYGDSDAAKVLTTAAGAGTYDASNLSVGNVRKTVTFGVSSTGTLEGCVDSSGTNQGTTGILASGTFHADGTLSSAGAYNATGVIYGSGSYATEASRNSTTAGSSQILTGYSVTIAGATTNGTLDLSLYTLISGVAAADDVRYGTPRYTGGGNGTLIVPQPQYLILGSHAGWYHVGPPESWEVTGTYDANVPYLAGMAAQLAADQAEVLAAAESIDGGVVILGQEGTGVNLQDVSDLFDEKLPSIYWYRVNLTIHNSAATPADEWLVIPMLGMAEVGTGAVTTPTLTVVDSAGTTLLSAVTLTEIGATGRYKYVATAANRTTPGASYVATPSGTIAAAARTGPGVQIARDY